MKKLKISFKSNRAGASYAISAVIITATTIALVLVASNFAYQILEQQRGMSEFDLVQESLVTFDDAVRDVAWSPRSSRFTRFAMDYGQLILIPNDSEHGLSLNLNIDGYQNANYSTNTGYLKYVIPSKYVKLDKNLSYYAMGDNRSVITDGTESVGNILIEQESGMVSAALTYRVRAMKTATTTTIDGVVSYVNIWIVKMKIASYSSYSGDLDLVSKAYSIRTDPAPFGATERIYDVIDGKCDISVQLGDMSPYTESVVLPEGFVVFNFIISEVEISP